MHFSLFYNFLADSDYPHDMAAVETRTAPVQSVVVMECRTELRLPVKFTWSRQGGILPKAARVEGVMIHSISNLHVFVSLWPKLSFHYFLSIVEIDNSGSEGRRCGDVRLHGPQR